MEKGTCIVIGPAAATWDSLVGSFLALAAQSLLPPPSGVGWRSEKELPLFQPSLWERAAWSVYLDFFEAGIVVKTPSPFLIPSVSSSVHPGPNFYCTCPLFRPNIVPEPLLQILNFVVVRRYQKRARQRTSRLSLPTDFVR